MSFSFDVKPQAARSVSFLFLAFAFLRFSLLFFSRIPCCSSSWFFFIVNFVCCVVQIHIPSSISEQESERAREWSRVRKTWVFLLFVGRSIPIRMCVSKTSRENFDSSYIHILHLRSLDVFALFHFHFTSKRKESDVDVRPTAHLILVTRSSFVCVQWNLELVQIIDFMQSCRSVLSDRQRIPFYSSFLFCSLDDSPMFPTRMRKTGAIIASRCVC